MSDTSTGQDGEQQASPASLLERMTAAGISEDRARAHIERGVVRVAGDTVTDPTAPTPWPLAWVLTAE